MLLAGRPAATLSAGAVVRSFGAAPFETLGGGHTAAAFLSAEFAFDFAH
jgi:hypothetical protein